MSKTLKASLNTKDISSLISKLETLDKEISKLPKKLSEEVAVEGLKVLDSLYAITPYDENIEDINTKVEVGNNKSYIVAEGKDVIYAEFGTGDEGFNNPHPLKNSVDVTLNPYNWGKTIRPADFISAEHGITSGLYWTYVKGGEVIYTQGVPSGKQFLNTSEYLQKEGIKEVGNRLVGDVLSKL